MNSRNPFDGKAEHAYGYVRFPDGKAAFVGTLQHLLPRARPDVRCLGCDSVVTPRLGGQRRPHYGHRPGLGEDCPLRSTANVADANSRPGGATACQGLEDLAAKLLLAEALQLLAQRSRQDELQIEVLCRLCGSRRRRPLPHGGWTQVATDHGQEAQPSDIALLERSTLVATIDVGKATRIESKDGLTGAEAYIRVEEAEAVAWATAVLEGRPTDALEAAVFGPACCEHQPGPSRHPGDRLPGADRPPSRPRPSPTDPAGRVHRAIGAPTPAPSPPRRPAPSVLPLRFPSGQRLPATPPPTALAPSRAPDVRELWVRNALVSIGAGLAEQARIRLELTISSAGVHDIILRVPRGSARERAPLVRSAYNLLGWTREEAMRRVQRLLKEALLYANGVEVHGDWTRIQPPIPDKPSEQP